MIDLYLSTLSTDELRDRIAMAIRWLQEDGNDGINPVVDPAYWQRQAKAADMELQARFTKGRKRQ